MKKIMLLGGSAQQVIAIETAKKMGYFTVLCDYLNDNPGQFHADKYYSVSTTDKEAVLEVAVMEKIDGILAYASDPAAPTAAYVAEKMGLPTNPYKSIEMFCNKDLFREFLISHGFNAPESKTFYSEKEALSNVGLYKFPIIVKPVDSSGSKGVTLVKTHKGVEKAIKHAFSYSRAGRIIVEKYIEKKHPFLIGGDIFVSDGKIIQWGLMNCHRSNRVNPLVPVGKSYPPILDEEELELAKNTLQELVTSSGIKYGPMNIELVIDNNNRVFPIDIGPRSGGNMIPDLLGIIFNCDLVEMSIRSAMGESINIGESNEGLYFATINIHSEKDGIFDHIEYSSELMKYIIRTNIYKKKGDYIHSFNNASDALGIVFLKYSELEIMIDMEEKMDQHIKVFVQGDV